MKERIFKVNPTLLPFIKNILERRKIQYSLNEDNTKITLSMSGEKYHKLVIRALCEKTDYAYRDKNVSPIMHPVELEDEQVHAEIGDHCVIINPQNPPKGPVD